MEELNPTTLSLNFWKPRWTLQSLAELCRASLSLKKIKKDSIENFFFTILSHSYHTLAGNLIPTTLSLEISFLPNSRWKFHSYYTLAGNSIPTTLSLEISFLPHSRWKFHSYHTLAGNLIPTKPSLEISFLPNPRWKSDTLAENFSRQRVT